MKLLLSLLVFLLCASSAAQAAIAFDAVTTGTGNNVDTVTVNHTVDGACANPYIRVDTGWQRTPIGTLDTVTVGGVSATLLGGNELASSWRNEAWRRVAVSTGLNAVVVTFDAVKNSITVLVRSYCGVDPSTPEGTTVTAIGGDQTPTVNVTSAIGELVVDGVQAAPNAGSQTLTVDASQTERGNFAQDNTNHVLGGSEQAGANPVTMSWTNGVAGAWSIVATPLKPAAAPPAARRTSSPLVFQ